MSRKIGVFVAWPYANGELHLGHIAGAYLPADIFARYHRLRGNSVLMVSGSDTHGTPVTLKAREEGLTPLEVVGRYHERFLQSFKVLGISFDLFTHTHTTNHIRISQDFFTRAKENGDLSEESEEQFFDEQAGMFLPDRYVEGSCPKCGYERARGDQCESCGATFAATELLNPKSRITNSEPVIRQTSHFFFDLSRYKADLEHFIEQQRHWRISVRNFSQAMVREGLRKRAITRDIDWGVPVPVEGWDSKVIYVWFDAVIGYLSASVEWSERRKAGDAWRQWWYDPEARGYYFIGKDNVPFHTVIWPIELMAYDRKLNLPYDVPANQFLNIDGEKFSTSSGRGIFLSEVLGDFSSDAVRYYLSSVLPETKDTSFSWEDFVRRNNGELVNAWGNLVNRVFGFAYSRYGGQVPDPVQFTERDEQLKAEVCTGFKTVAGLLEAVQLRDALKETMRITREVNKYIDDKAPWEEYKESPQKAASTIFSALWAIDSLKVLFAPFIPESSSAIHKLFGYETPLFGELEIGSRELDCEQEAALNPADMVLTYHSTEAEQKGVDRWKPSELQPGQSFSKASPLFKVLEQEE